MERGGQLPYFAFLGAAPGPIGLLFPHQYGWSLQASFIYSRCPFGFFSWRIMLQCIYLTPSPRRRSLPIRRRSASCAGDLPVDPPLVVLLYSVSLAPLLRIIFQTFCNTRWGRVASTSLVEVNQAILAWSF